MIAEAPAAQAAAIGHGHPSGAPPPGALTFQVSTLQACWMRINEALMHNSEEELSAAIEWGTGECDQLQLGAKDRFRETGEQFAYRVIRDYEGLTAPEVVRREHGTTSVTTVRNLRVADGRDPRTGRKTGD